MTPPSGQPKTDELRGDVEHAGGWSSRRRVQLAVAPLYAAYRLAFLGRPAAPIRGGGVGLDVDVHLVTPVWLRLSASYTAHPVQNAYTREDEEAVATLSARAGVIHTVDLGGGVMFAMDLGRVIPVLEAGLGAMIVRTPAAAIDGQMGGACLDGGCDVGLYCAADNVCRQGVVPEAHAGAAIEILLKDQWTLGASIRYYALLTAPTVFPIYLQAGLRLGVRF